MNIDMKQVAKSFKDLQNYRAQVVGLGLLPPDLQEFIKLIENSDAIIKDFDMKRADLQKQIESLGRSKETLQIASDGYLAEHNKFKAGIDAKRSALIKEIGDMNAQVAALKADLEKTKNEHKAELTLLLKEKADHQAAIGRVKAEMEGLRRKLA